MPELLPTRSLYQVNAPVGIEVRGLAGPAQLRVLSLGQIVESTPVAGDGFVDVGPLPPGGYGVVLAGAQTAVQVLPLEQHRFVLRYGFVADYRPGRELTEVLDNIRRLHLTAVQCYDWAYRHADLVGGGEEYTDALGNPVSLDTVRRIVGACHDAGADAIGYAAVYAVGGEEWPRWSGHALRTATGAAYRLGDFLRLVDPAAPAWVAHLSQELAAATELVGFDGYHLDQYGYPKHALGPSGEVVDVARSFVSAIESLRSRLPRSRLIFNNVNDFPTWATASTAQDAVYIEVWEPNAEYADLARLVTAARAAGKPVCVAAYQHVYDTALVAAADQATALTMATLFSHGATHLLAGEADRILVDPYYVRNHPVQASTADLLKRWYDFLVEHHDLLMPAGIVDVTAAYAGAYNGDLDVEYAAAAVETSPVAGTVWRRVTRVGDWLVVHLVNLVGQPSTRWDAPHLPPGDPGTGTLRLRLVTGGSPWVLVADPDGSGHLEPVVVRADGVEASADLPALHTWQVVLVRRR
ncbi:MAG TPA: glycoside hydrolase family 66 protein [Dermatophilaceae bacterium]|nr:glycoside hydrolase family 66 protein [Dermatophilaceae bacterium]